MRTVTALLCFLFVLTAAAFALPPKDFSLNSNAANSDYDTFIDANSILMFVTNRATFARDLSNFFGYGYGTWYPFYGDTIAIRTNDAGAGEHSPMYAAGIWMGGVTASEDTLVAIAEYGAEYVPGPMSGGTFQADQPEFRVYKLYFDSLGANPNTDYTEWPVAQGGPVHQNGLPVMHGNQMLWSVFNDADPGVHDGRADPGTTDPMGVEVQMTTYGFSSGGGAVYIAYKLINKGSNSFHDFYFSVWADPDVGSAGNDYVGCDTVNQIWYAYNSEGTDNQYPGIAPPAVGFKLLYGPVVPAMGEVAYFDGSFIEDYKNLPMASFNKYSIGNDPTNFRETYRFMNGLNADGSPYTYNGNPVKFMHSGDPIAGVGDLDFNSSDRRMMASFGPFDLASGDSQYVLIAMGSAIGSSFLNSINQLKATLNLATYLPSPVLAKINDRYALVGDELTIELAAAIENGDTVSFSVNPILANSTLADHGDGSATYSFTPAIGQVGDQALTFTVDNGTTQDDQSATIHVLATNAAPVLTPIGVQEFTETNWIGLPLSASDPDGPAPILSGANLPEGAFVVDEHDGTGYLNWLTNYDDSGAYAITFYATDSLFSSSVDSEVVTIHIINKNRPPHIISPPQGTGIYAYTNQLLTVDVIAEDEDGDSLTMSVLWLFPPAGAVFEDNYDNTGTLTWIPSPSQASTYFLTFRAADAALKFDVSSAIIVKCCYQTRGNANGDYDDKVNISDVTYLTRYLFGTPSGPAPICTYEGNANGDPEEKINITDVTFLVEYLFGIPAGDPPPPCPAD